MTASEEGTSSLAKTLQILDLFTEEQPVWSTAAIIDALDATRSTGYRYIKALHDAGLLASIQNGHYSLGPRIIEMDLKLRLTDPLYLASRGALEDLVGEIGHSATLCTAYGDSVLCIDEFRSAHSPANRVSRGQARSLFQGAVAKVILAHLPHYRLKAIYPRQASEIERAGLGSTWKEFRATLGTIKRNGYHVTFGEFNPGVTGVAAPILTEQKSAIGSVGVAWDEHARQDIRVEDAVRAVKEAATTIAARLERRQ
jgi:DNA-binding IclR family transcriptional regulator